MDSEADGKVSRAEPSHVLITLLSSVAVLLYAFAVMKRVDRRLSGHVTFESDLVLSHWQMAAFLAVYTVEVLAIMATATTILQSIVKHLAPKLAWLSSVPVSLAVFTVITVKLRLLRIVKDGIDFAMVRSLGGGSVLGALSYVREEALRLCVPIGLFAGLVVFGSWLLKKYRLRVAGWLDSKGAVRSTLRPKWLVAANVAVVILSTAVAVASPPVNEVLADYFPCSIYSLPIAWINEHHSAQDPGRAFALPAGLVPGMGAVPAPVWRAPLKSWDATRLERKNVLLIVLETARLEIQSAVLGGAPVMPTLQKLGGQPISFVSPSGISGPAIRGILTGDFATAQKPGISLVDRFREMQYRTAILSAQNETWDENRRKCRMDDADLFIDSTLFPQDHRLHSWWGFGGLSMPGQLVTDKFRTWLESSDQSRPFFAYVNIQEMHYPYYYAGLPLELTRHPIAVSEMQPAMRDAVRETYLNAARAADRAIESLVAHLDAMHLRENTVILITGDHGEELYDHGYLGHGINLSCESYWTVGRLIHSRWKPPDGPVATADATTVLYNALLRSPEQTLPLDNEVLCYAGEPTRPAAVGLATSQGLVRYHFKKRRWTKQSGFGAPELPAGPNNRLIQKWTAFASTLAAEIPAGSPK